MEHEDFAKIVASQQALCSDVLVDKARQYASGHDKLHNFKVAAAVEGVTVKQALAGMMAKHTVSIYDMCRSLEQYDEDVWNEKITDHLNYLLLLKAVVMEEKMNPLDSALPNL